MSGAGAVAAIVLLEWSLGGVAAAAWTQSWAVVRRGHFRILAWSALGLAIVAMVANASATQELAGSAQPTIVGIFGALVFIYLAVQYAHTHVPGVVVGTIAALAGVVALVATARLLTGWPDVLAVAGLLSGALLLGAVTNGMLLGHWYLNQPGLKPWALERLTDLCLVAIGAALASGLLSVGKLAAASTSGAVLGIAGFGESFGAFFYAVWVALTGFTGVVVWMARRCVRIRSIQSATGLFYVAILTAGVSEFLVRYLMVNVA